MVKTPPGAASRARSKSPRSRSPLLPLDILVEIASKDLQTGRKMAIASKDVYQDVLAQYNLTTKEYSLLNVFYTDSTPEQTYNAFLKLNLMKLDPNTLTGLYYIIDENPLLLGLIIKRNNPDIWRRLKSLGFTKKGVIQNFLYSQKVIVQLELRNIIPNFNPDVIPEYRMLDKAVENKDIIEFKRILIRLNQLYPGNQVLQQILKYV